MQPTFLQRIYRLKVTIVALVSLGMGIGLQVVAENAHAWPDFAWLTFLPLSDIGGTLFAAGLFGIAWDYFDGRDKEKREDERIRRLLKESAPEFRDAVVQGFAVNSDDLERVATPELLDSIAVNVLALRLRNRDFAGEIYEDIRDQAIRAPERWYDVNVSIHLSSIDDEDASAVPRYAVTVQWEYTVTPSHATQRFACVSDRDEFHELVSDVPTTSTWFMTPRPGFDASDRQAFELLQFHVDGEPCKIRRSQRRTGDTVFLITVLVLIAWGLVEMLGFVSARTGLGEFGVAAGLGLLTFGRVLILLTVGTLVWVPVGVWIGLSPKVTRIAQPIVQVLASFPANFLFPFATLALIATGISLNWGGIVLMSLGAQWYILFNVVAGASAIPNDLREAATSMRLPRRQKWRSLYCPAIFGSWVTGGITAAGGAWNASIVSEVVSYGHTTLHAAGLGAYIAESTATGDFAKTLVGVTVMSVFVVGLNRLFWRRLSTYAETRFSLT